MKKLTYIVSALVVISQLYAAEAPIPKATIAKWLDNSASELSGKVTNTTAITLVNGENALIAEVIGNEATYALIRPSIKQARYLDDLSDDFYKALNHDFTFIPTEKSTIIVTEGGGHQQGHYASIRKFVSFNGWKVNILHEVDAGRDNIGACEEFQDECTLSKTSYSVVSTSPLTIQETTYTEAGPTTDKMKKNAPIQRTIVLQK